ncbi:efflux RND transporter permease subunit [Deltaproteobacteria bacterium OttesenSCG-928-K17]|nr:efflux RND transporter permease subunit [Deltaproteobacteria bacterium OttesenSCG-928-K17]
MSKFFINRPIFAWVVAIVIMLGGLMAIRALPITQYPDVAAPAVYINGSYPGASAQTVQDTVVQVIEQQISGLDGFRYISSESTSTGSFSIIVTFEQGTDPDIAQVQVQNKLSLAQSMLPLDVQNQGISVGKYQINFMIIVSLYCDNGLYNKDDLGNYLISNLKDPLSRTQGVGEIMQMAGQYAMRIWLNPEKLHSYQLMPSDVVAAINSQNVQVSSGQIGGLPTVDGVQLNATVIGKNKMTAVEDFNDILLKTNLDGSRIRLRDVATVELGSENYNFNAKYNDYPSAALAVRLAAGGNVLEATKAVKDTVAELEPFFPDGIKVVYPYETAPSVEASIGAVIKTLIEAIILVFLVMYLFLQDFRATIIPTLAVPVVLLGTYGVLFAFGFTINIITMMAMVLAIGLLVDDAIVVVENVERLMVDEHLPPKEATEKSMGQIQGALVGIGLVISAVFFPMAFFGGSTGVIYRQFSVTIIAAMSLSVIIAIVFTPALCATMLKHKKEHSQPKGLLLGRFFSWFNRMFFTNSQRYARGVEEMLRRKRLFAAITVGIFGLVIFIFPMLPTAFLPNEDNGSMMVSVQLPPNASEERAEVVLQQIRDYYLNEEKDTVQEIMTVGGFSFAGRGQNVAMLFVKGRDYSERTSPDRSMFALAGRSWGRFSRIADASIIPIVPPPIAELGNATGFDFYLMDRGGIGHDELMAARNQFLGMAAQDPILTMVRPNGMNDEPQYKVVIDDEKARSLTTNLSDINNTMTVAWASAYVNDFIDRGRVKKVFVQGEPGSRVSPEDFDRWHVRNASGQMVPFSAFAEGSWTMGAPKLERYNGVAAMEILGQPIEGVSSGDAMNAVERIAKELPPGVSVSFTGLSYEERLAGDQTAQLYAISLLIVFLCLAALYESWSIPVSVMLIVPMGVLGAVAANLLRGLNNDVFFQVGILTVIGLSAKNAILIVEFAKDLHEKEGRTLMAAAVEAAKLRFRPILMTSLAFIFGVLPMAKASGASAASQQALGTTVVGGTFSATCLAVFFVPLFYVLVAGLFHKEKNAADQSDEKSLPGEASPLSGGA